MTISILGCVITHEPFTRIMAKEHGGFEIQFDESSLRDLFLHRQPELFFKVSHEDELLRSAGASLVWRADNLSEIAIEVDEPHHDEAMLTKTEHVQTDEKRERDGTRAKQLQEETRDLPISDLAKEFQVKLTWTLSTYFTGVTRSPCWLISTLPDIPSVLQDDPAVRVPEAHVICALRSKSSTMIDGNRHYVQC